MVYSLHSRFDVLMCWNCAPMVMMNDLTAIVIASATRPIAVFHQKIKYLSLFHCTNASRKHRANKKRIPRAAKKQQLKWKYQTCLMEAKENNKIEKSVQWKLLLSFLFCLSGHKGNLFEWLFVWVFVKLHGNSQPKNHNFLSLFLFHFVWIGLG